MPWYFPSVGLRCLTWGMQISTDALIEHAASLAALNGVDPGSLSGDEASKWLSALARVRTSTEAVMAALARRIEDL